ncbi:trypsin-like peptidase domain-containing protein [Streptomyces sp. NBC_00637]
MDDGKPTRAKWWSRPRPQVPPGRQGPADPDDAAAAEPASEETAPREPSIRTDDEGDFALARPARPTPPTDDGDYELSRPAGETASATHPAPSTTQAAAPEVASVAPVPEAMAAHADPTHPDALADLGIPAASEISAVPGTPAVPEIPAAPVAPEIPAAPGAPVGLVDPDGPADMAGPELSAVAANPEAPAAPVAPAAPTDVVRFGEVASTEPPPVTGGRSKPLHDPDPYSTPPYGEPGPWAPAPPVQHPAATTASVPAAHGAPPSTPAPGTVPASAEPASVEPGGPGTAAIPATAAVSPASPGVPAEPALPASPTLPAGPAGPVAPAGPTGSAEPFVGPAGGQALVGHSGPSLRAEPVIPADPWHRYDPWSATPAAGATASAEGPQPGVLVGGPLQYSGTGGLPQYAGTAVLTGSERRRQVRRRLIGGALAVALVSGGLGGAVGAYLERNGGLDPVELPQAAAEPAGRSADSVAGIAARALPGVVTLHVSGSGEAATGTGFVLDSRGYILTNNHVVAPAGGDGGITVVFNGGQTAEAEVVGRDSGYDLAVVRVTGVKGLEPLPLGNSDNVRVGDPVVAIGAPFDLEGTVTSGIISARERPITAGGESGDGSDVSYVDALQTDAPINPGNSGGPLLDARGQVIGINSAIRSAADGTGSGSTQAGSIGLGFAIPVNQGKRVAEELINTGRATHPVIGVTLDMGYAGDGARIGTADGAAGSPVTEGGPADRAGVRAGDVVTEIDGRPVHSGEELIVKTRAHRPGDRLALTIERDGRERTLTLVLGSSGG